MRARRHRSCRSWTLGIPSNATMAVLSGAMIVHGIQPGPKVMVEQPKLFWGLICSMWIGNVMLLIINLPLVRLWAKTMDIPYRYLGPAVVVLCCIGVLRSDQLFAALAIMAGFARCRLAAARTDCEPAPLVLGFVLGPLMEENLRRALLVSGGNPAVFVERPISLALLLGAVALLLVLYPDHPTGAWSSQQSRSVMLDLVALPDRHLATISDAAASLGGRRVSSAELVVDTLARIDRMNPVLHAFNTVDHEGSARAGARVGRSICARWNARTTARSASRHQRYGRCAGPANDRLLACARLAAGAT